MQKRFQSDTNSRVFEMGNIISNNNNTQTRKRKKKEISVQCIFD